MNVYIGYNNELNVLLFTLLIVNVLSLSVQRPVPAWPTLHAQPLSVQPPVRVWATLHAQSTSVLRHVPAWPTLHAQPSSVQPPVHVWATMHAQPSSVQPPVPVWPTMHAQPSSVLRLVHVYGPPCMHSHRPYMACTGNFRRLRQNQVTGCIHQDAFNRKMHRIIDIRYPNHVIIYKHLLQQSQMCFWRSFNVFLYFFRCLQIIFNRPCNLNLIRYRIYNMNIRYLIY